MTTGDVLAAHVRHLLQLDEKPQKAMLASLSSYADNRTWKRNLAAQSLSGKKRSEHAPCSDMLSTEILTDVHSTPPTAENSATPEIPLEPMKVMISGARANGSWPRFVQEPGVRLPSGTANLMPDLLIQTATRETSLGQQRSIQTQMTDQNIAAMRWLTQHWEKLQEKRQESSVHKIRSTLAHSCSGMEDAVGINVPLQTSIADALLCTPRELKGSNGSLGSGVDTAGFAHGLLGTTQPPTLSGGQHIGNPVPGFGLKIFPHDRGYQQLPAEVRERAAGQPMDRRVWQNARKSGRKAAVCQRHCGYARPAASVGLAGGPPATLRIHLESLLSVDSNRVFIVRKINRLGFASETLLLGHFSWYGVVERVLVAHSRAKRVCASTGGGSVSLRLRPSGLGSVVMSRVVDAQAILAHGSEQQINGVLIHVQQFERHMSAVDGDGKEEDSNTAIPETSLSDENCNSMSNSSSCEDSG